MCIGEMVNVVNGGNGAPRARLWARVAMFYILVTRECVLMRWQRVMPAAAVSKSGEFGARECKPIGCGVPVVGKLNLVVVVNYSGGCSLVARCC